MTHWVFSTFVMTLWKHFVSSSLTTVYLALICPVRLRFGKLDLAMNSNLYLSEI